MDRIKQLWAKIQPIKTSGATVILDEFEICAAIFAARTSVKLERYQIQKVSKKGIGTKRRVAAAKRALKKDVRSKEAVVEFLEKELKRSSQLFKSLVGPADFKSQSTEWRSHLKRIEFHFTYFKVPSSAAAGRLERRRSLVDTLVQMTGKAIVDQGYELPKSADLYAVLWMFFTNSLRRRRGEFDHIFMVRNKK